MQIAKFSWDAVEIADGYNLYIDGVKENADLITDTFFLKEGLEPGSYEAYATSVTQGIESDPSNVHVLEIALPPFCVADGIAMTTDFYRTRHDDVTDELFVTKIGEDGVVINETKLNYTFTASNASSALLVGNSLDESVFYILQRNTGVFSFDAETGDQIGHYDPGALENPRGDVSSIARDGRIATFHDRTFESDALQVLNPDMSLAFSESYMNNEDFDGLRGAKFDACGNLIVIGTAHVTVYSPTYEVLFTAGQEVFQPNPRAFMSLALGAGNSFIVFGFRDNENNNEIPVTKIELGDFTYESIASIPTNLDLSEFASILRHGSIIDADGNCWFTAESNTELANKWVGLGRIATDGTVTFWKQLIEGSEFGSPNVSLEYSHPSNYLIAHAPDKTVLVDLNTIDAGDPDVIVPIAEVNGGGGNSARFAPGEYSVMKGVDAQ